MLGVTVEVTHGKDAPSLLHTDVTGAFRLEDLAAGRYRVHIAQPGFENYRVRGRNSACWCRSTWSSTRA